MATARAKLERELVTDGAQDLVRLACGTSLGVAWVELAVNNQRAVLSRKEAEALWDALEAALHAVGDAS